VTTRAERRRRDKNGTKPGSPYIYIPIPEEWRDSMGDAWGIARGGVIEELDFIATLQWSIRKLPVKTAEDAERALDILQVTRAAGDTLELRKDDYDWLITRFRESLHLIWSGPESALLRRYLETNSSGRSLEIKPEGLTNELRNL